MLTFLLASAFAAEPATCDVLMSIRREKNFDANVIVSVAFFDENGKYLHSLGQRLLPGKSGQDICKTPETRYTVSYEVDVSYGSSTWRSARLELGAHRLTVDMTPV